MRLFDTPVLFNRTPRELLLIGIGLGGCVFIALHQRMPHMNLAIAAVLTGLFAARYFAMRAVGVGVIFSALIFHVVGLRYGDNWIGGRDGVPWFFWGMVAILVLLTSSDLVQRFDMAKGTGWRHNPWRLRPRSHWIGACLGGYAIGTLANLLVSLWFRNGMDASFWWLPVLAGVSVISLLLMIQANKAGYVLALAIAIGAAALTLPYVGGAESYLADGWAVQPEWTLWRSAPHLALPIAILAGATALVSVAMLRANGRARGEQ
jgi:hypothetical protein